MWARSESGKSPNSASHTQFNVLEQDCFITSDLFAENFLRQRKKSSLDWVKLHWNQLSSHKFLDSLIGQYWWRVSQGNKASTRTCLSELLMTYFRSSFSLHFQHRKIYCTNYVQGRPCKTITVFWWYPQFFQNRRFNRNDREYITQFFGRYLQKIEQVQECDSLISSRDQSNGQSIDVKVTIPSPKSVNRPRLLTT